MNKKENEVSLEVLRTLYNNPKFSQRDLASTMGVSLGKINYIVKEMSKRGLIKINNFSKSKNKLNYIYLLTPEGIKKKISLTKRFMDIKLKEYDELKKEIDLIENKKN